MIQHVEQKKGNQEKIFKSFFYCLKFPLRIIPDDYSFFFLSPLILIIILCNINFSFTNATLNAKEESIFKIAPVCNFNDCRCIFTRIKEEVKILRDRIRKTLKINNEIYMIFNKSNRRRDFYKFIYKETRKNYY